MSETTGGQQSFRPPTGADLKPRLYHIATAFNPKVRLDRRAGYAFAISLCDYMEVEAVRIESHTWKFEQPLTGSRSRFAIDVTPDKFSIFVEFPQIQDEWFESKCLTLLRRFFETFKPQVLVQSAIQIAASISIGADARDYLAGRVLQFDPEKLAKFERPVHAIGLRLVFPPFERQVNKRRRVTTEWQVDLKVESLLEDPSQIYVEAQASWPKSEQWTESTVENIVGHLSDTKQFIQNNAIKFLSA